MTEKDKHISNFFRQKLSDYEHPVKEDMWNRIEKELPKQSISKTKILFPIIGVAASIALLVTVGFFFLSPEQENQVNLADSNEMTEIENTVLPENKQETKELSNENNSPEEIIGATESRHLTKGSASSQGNITPYSEEEILTQNDERKGESDEDITVPINDEIKKTTPPQNGQQTKRTGEDRIPIKRQTHNQRVSLALAMGNNPTANSSNTYMYTRNSVVDKCSESITAIEKNPELTSYADMNPESQEGKNQANTVETKYKQPFSVGLSVRKQISDKWAIESGLVYTRLSSTEIHKVENREISRKDIDLDYLGIPIKGVYSIYSTKNVSVYAAAGGMMEKNIAGKESEGNDSKSVSIKRMQFSLLGNIGVGYRLIDQVSVFFEPGVSYFFDDGSNIETIRKDRPFNYNLQGGIRYSF